MNAAEAIAAELSILPRGQGGGKFPPKRQKHFLPKMQVAGKDGKPSFWNREVKYIKGINGFPTIKIPRVGPKGNTLSPLITSKMLVVVHEFWAGLHKEEPYEPGRKSQSLCWSVSHVKPGQEEVTKGPAVFGQYDTKQWAQQMQMRGARTLVRSEDVKDEETGATLVKFVEVPGEQQDCYTCKLLNLDDSDRECRLDAPLVFTILKVWSEEDDAYVEPKGGPIMAYLQQNESSAEALPRYVRRLSQSGISVDGIITELSLAAVKNGNYKLAYNEYGEDEQTVADANEAFAKAKGEWQAERDAYIAKMKAERDGANGVANNDYAPKAQTPAPAAKPKTEKPKAAAAPPPPADGGEEAGDDDCPF